METVSNEACVLVRFDPAQHEACVVGVDLERSATTVTFGPERPASWDRGENLLINILRVLVEPYDEAQLYDGGDR